MKCWSKCYQMLPLMPTTSTGERDEMIHWITFLVFPPSAVYFPTAAADQSQQFLQSVSAVPDCVASVTLLLGDGRRLLWLPLVAVVVL